MVRASIAPTAAPRIFVRFSMTVPVQKKIAAN
jgi:hypothetical protein